MGEWLDNMIFAKGDEGQIDVPSRDGTHPQFTAGKALQALQVLSGNKLIDKVPYIFRKSGSGKGLMEKNTYVGASVAWNQLFTAQTFTNTSTDTRSYVQVMLKSYTGNVTIMGSSNVQATGKFEKLFTALASSTGGLKLIHNGSSTNFNFATTASDSIEGHKYYIGATFTGVDPTTVGGTSAKEFVLVDLTLALGSAVADYIYALGNTNNAGINKLREWGFLTKPYYAYNAGAILSVNASKHIMTGFNQWDEVWEKGSLDAYGQNYVSNSNIRSKNYIPICPSTAYYFNSPNNLGLCWYDADKNFIFTENTSSSIVRRTSPSNAYYLRFYVAQAYGTTYNNDICINISGAQDGTYEPYTVNEYALDPDLTLRGILKLDGSNNLYADGDVYEADGTVTRKYGIVDLGSLTWHKSSSGNKYYTTMPEPYYKMRWDGMKAVCSRYINDGVGTSASGYYPTIDKAFRMAYTATPSSSSYELYFHDEAYTTDSAFQTAMDGVYLVYELATPTTETADPYNEVQVCSPYGTEEYVDAGVAAGTRDVAIPVGHETEYDQPVAMLPDAPSSNGNYKLRCTVSGGVPTYSWVSE